MRIGVFGAGAVGGYVGARLAAAGEDVTFIARGAHLDAIRESGLRLDKIKKPKFKYFLKAKKAIQENEKLKARYDTNRDGTLDHEELERGSQRLAQRLSDKHSQVTLEERIPKTKLIFKKNVMTNRQTHSKLPEGSRASRRAKETPAASSPARLLALNATIRVAIHLTNMPALLLILLIIPVLF